jgi:cytochrome c553
MSAPDRLALARACLLLACAGLAPLAQAQDGGIEQGRQLASQGAGAAVPACAGCHGARGEGGAAFPRLAGTGQAYLQAQLEAFASGARKNPLMQPIAQGLSPAQRQSVTLYYSKLAAPTQAVDAAQPTPAEAGAWLATRGRWTDQVPACAQCHGPGGNGVGAHFPPLAGLPAAYITAQLQAWKGGSRPPGPLGLMKAVAGKLGEADIGAVSSYYAGLGAAAVAGTAPTGGKGKATP